MRKLSEAAFTQLVHDFNAEAVELWNAGDLEELCARYAPNASFITKEGGYLKSREQILAGYRADFPDHSKMGSITVDLCELRFPPHDPDEGVSMAVGIVHWRTKIPDGTGDSGFSMATFELTENGLWVTQDVSP